MYVSGHGLVCSFHMHSEMCSCSLESILYAVHALGLVEFQLSSGSKHAHNIRVCQKFGIHHILWTVAAPSVFSILDSKIVNFPAWHDF